jgi:hypothetical protein
MIDRARVLAPALLLAVAGCVHTQPLGPLQELPEHARASARDLGNPVYGEAPSADPSAVALAEMVLGSVPPERASQVSHAPGLDGVAELVAQVIQREGRELADPVVEQLVWHAGVAAELVGYTRAVVSGGGGQAFLEQHLRGIPWPEEGNFVFGVARAAGNPTVQVIVLAHREILIDPLPRSVATGGTQVVSGNLVAKVDDLLLLVDDGPTRVREVAVPVDADGRFEVSLTLPAASGRRMLEWTGIDENGWRASLLAVPVWVGEPAPDEPEQVLASEVPNPVNVAEWEAVVLSRVNALRAEAGHPLMEPHPAASRIAARQAAATARDPLAPPARLFEELNAAGLRTRDVHEYRGMTYNLDARITRALERPSVREMLLRPSMTRLSVAFAPAEDGGHADTWVVSEVLAAFDARSLAGLLLRDLNRQRVRRGSAEVQTASALDAIAQGYADRACAGDPDAAAFLEAEAQKLRGYLVRGYQVLTAPVLHPTVMRGAFDDPPTAENLLSDHSHVGTGACERGEPGSMDNEWVVFMFADATAR